ncbi:fimbrial protein [Citrobacter sp. BDA59-3]|uniref:fimbrial protein n=1 Tax=Citrobacter sp. BDA59-3 TaxID=2781952 RepID=UPI00187F79F5|nr:fimbrial protein [Citrobacter sp. BDA59-3]QOV69671.1 type 1 fimbrial protein [Citrobacter sp. BDA59-3]
MNNRTLFIQLVKIAGLLIISPKGYVAAGCVMASGYSVQNYSVPISTSISVPRNAATGPIGSEIKVSSGGPATKSDCTYTTSRYRYMLDKVLSPGGTTSIDGVYQTNVSGIGVRIRATAPFFTTPLTIYSTATELGSLSSASNLNDEKIGAVYVQFYVIGPVSPGNVILSAPTLAGMVGTDRSETSAVTFSNLTITGSVPVTVLACETPDIRVDLKKHESAEFPTVGSTSSATNFNFVIKNCPSKLNSVNYTFKPASGITLKGSGTGQYLTLDSGSTAKGVGVQVLYGNGTNVPFNTKTKYTGYSTSTGGSYTIPMKARYIRTGTISPGTANSAVEFDMSYE